MNPMANRKQMANESCTVNLDVGRHYLSGTLLSVTNEEGFIEVVVSDNGEKFRIFYPLDTLEGQALNEKLTTDMIGKNLLIYRMADLTDPLRIEIRPEGAHGSP